MRFRTEMVLPCRPSCSERETSSAMLGDMTKPPFSAQPDLERCAPDLLQFDALHAAAGRPAPGAVPHALIYYANSKTVIELLDILLQVVQARRQPRSDDDRARLGNALQGFEQIADAVQRMMWLIICSRGHRAKAAMP